MDNNFSNILDIFKRLDESNEFAGQAVGQKPGEQWHGTDAGTPGNKLVGASEGIEQECDTNAPMSPLEAKLRARWEATKEGLAEYGMTSGGTTGAPAPTDGSAPQAPNPADAQKLKAGVQSLKSAGLDIDPNKLNQALTTASTGGETTNQDEKAFAAMAPQIAGIASNPQLNQQFKQLLDKNKQAQANASKQNPPAQGTA